MSKKSLHFGINDYPGTKSDLRGCVNDARDWEKELKKRGFATKILLDSQCTKANMIKEFERIVDATGPDDIAVITYSGHGTWVPDRNGDEADGRDEALCPHDIAKGQVLLDDELVKIFNKRGYSSRVIFISDSCHSGTVARAVPGFLDDDMDPQARYLAPEVFIDDEELLAKAVKVENDPHNCQPEAAAVLFSGCNDTEYSYDANFKGKPQGAFTHVAIRELNKLAPAATYADWFREIRKYLPHQRYPQTPQLQANKAQKKWKIFEA